MSGLLTDGDALIMGARVMTMANKCVVVTSAGSELRFPKTYADLERRIAELARMDESVLADAISADDSDRVLDNVQISAPAATRELLPLWPNVRTASPGDSQDSNELVPPAISTLAKELIHIPALLLARNAKNVSELAVERSLTQYFLEHETQRSPMQKLKLVIAIVRRVFEQNCGHNEGRHETKAPTRHE